VVTASPSVTAFLNLLNDPWEKRTWFLLKVACVGHNAQETRRMISLITSHDVFLLLVSENIYVLVKTN